jgi:hypothetical protein
MVCLSLSINQNRHIFLLMTVICVAAMLGPPPVFGQRFESAGAVPITIQTESGSTELLVAPLVRGLTFSAKSLAVRHDQKLSHTIGIDSAYHNTLVPDDTSRIPFAMENTEQGMLITEEFTHCEGTRWVFAKEGISFWADDSVYTSRKAGASIFFGSRCIEYAAIGARGMTAEEKSERQAAIERALAHLSDKNAAENDKATKVQTPVVLSRDTDNERLQSSQIGNSIAALRMERNRLQSSGECTPIYTKEDTRLLSGLVFTIGGLSFVAAILSHIAGATYDPEDAVVRENVRTAHVVGFVFDLAGASTIAGAFGIRNSYKRHNKLYVRQCEDRRTATIAILDTRINSLSKEKAALDSASLERKPRWTLEE